MVEFEDVEAVLKDMIYYPLDIFNYPPEEILSDVPDSTDFNTLLHNQEKENHKDCSYALADSNQGASWANSQFELVADGIMAFSIYEYAMQVPASSLIANNVFFGSDSIGVGYASDGSFGAIIFESGVPTIYPNLVSNTFNQWNKIDWVYTKSLNNLKIYFNDNLVLYATVNVSIGSYQFLIIMQLISGTHEFYYDRPYLGGNEETARLTGLTPIPIIDGDQYGNTFQDNAIYFEEGNSTHPIIHSKGGFREDQVAKLTTSYENYEGMLAIKDQVKELINKKVEADYYWHIIDIDKFAEEPFEYDQVFREIRFEED
jgi:hypothetical protein